MGRINMMHRGKLVVLCVMMLLFSQLSCGTSSTTSSTPSSTATPQSVTFSWPSSVDGCTVTVESLNVIDKEAFFEVNDLTDSFVWSIYSPSGIASPVTYGVVPTGAVSTLAAADLVVGKTYVLGIASSAQCDDGMPLHGFSEFTAIPQ